MSSCRPFEINIIKFRVNYLSNCTLFHHVIHSAPSTAATVSYIQKRKTAEDFYLNLQVEKSPCGFRNVRKYFWSLNASSFPANATARRWRLIPAWLRRPLDGDTFLLCLDDRRMATISLYASKKYQKSMGIGRLNN